MKFVTLSRDTGSLGDEIAKGLAENLNVLHITRDYVLKNWFPEIATAHELHMLSESPGYYMKTSASGIVFQDFLEKKLHETVAGESVIISGLGSQLIFQSHREALHVKITGSKAARIERMIRRNNLSHDDAEKILEHTDRRHRRYIQLLYKTDWMDTLLYHVNINTDKVEAEEAISLILDLYRKKRMDPGTVEEAVQSEEIHFKNESEEEFAKVLDLYNLEWEYEPRTFPLKWDSEGNITQAFSPDFYLPRFNTYIELTIMNQKYTSIKRKKMALLKKLYPGTNISIVYKNDFHSLVERFAQWGDHVHE
ncbi:cytidylate kinase family protein [Proteiniclasticum sp. C24MP]|uniref:cytidylate kinase family protein n=1 Tax=Proteiniclasticum sp. C24MP TaxID=3374101 RepID=UPI003753F258